MNKSCRLLTLAFAALFLSGCVISIDGDWEDDEHWAKRQRENREAIADLELGLRRATVEERLGTPDFVEAFVRGADEFELLYYRTHRSHGDGETTRDETTPLVFVGGDLVTAKDVLYGGDLAGL